MIVVAGLSPAWQQILQFSHWQRGHVCRADKALWCASGKVVNVATALHTAGADVTLVSIVGGWSGDLVRHDVSQLNIPARWISTRGTTRCCTTVLSRLSGEATELVENVSAIAENEVEAFDRAVLELLPTAEGFVFTGSLPQGYAAERLVNLVQQARCPVLLDVRGDALLACLPLQPWLVKPNREELRETLGLKGASDDVQVAIEMLRQQGATRVVVSEGARGLWAVDADGPMTFVPARPVTVVNPIGCGDCLAAGLILGAVRGWSFPQCVLWGRDWAAENAGQLLPARCAVPPPCDVTPGQRLVNTDRDRHAEQER